MMLLLLTHLTLMTKISKITTAKWAYGFGIFFILSPVRVSSVNRINCIVRAKNLDLDKNIEDYLGQVEFSENAQPQLWSVVVNYNELPWYEYVGKPKRTTKKNQGENYKVTYVDLIGNIDPDHTTEISHEKKTKGDNSGKNSGRKGKGRNSNKNNFRNEIGNDDRKIIKNDDNSWKTLERDEMRHKRKFNNKKNDDDSWETLERNEMRHRRKFNNNHNNYYDNDSYEDHSRESSNKYEARKKIRGKKKGHWKNGRNSESDEYMGSNEYYYRKKSY